MLGDGNITLEEYVFSLRDKVGVNNLVEVVAIGKGKRDLTGTAMDSTKAIQSLPVRPRLPKTRACSSLTATEIVRFLTGNFRLRKAQLNDLFWDAVWPRLLARGWHSEQPSDQVSAGTKQSLVFLVPDVSKFSRRLTKGTHFFSSISDVLNKVASDPSLLELEVNSDNDEQQEEKRVINPEVSRKQLRRSHLQQNNSACNQHSMKFTVVDTSLVSGVVSGKVWETRSLPLDLINSASSGHLSEENHGSDPVDVDNVEAYGDADNDITSISKDQLPNGPVSLIKEEKTTQSITEVEPQFASISEHINISVCSNRGLSHKTENRYIDDDCLSERKLEYQASFPDAHANLSVPSQKSSSDSSISSNQEERHVRNLCENSLAFEQSHKNSILDNPEDDQGLSVNTLNNPDSLSVSAAKQSSSPCETEQCSEMLESITEEPPPVTTCQRRSSRNKPSAKALEAFAYGFMGPSKKRKGTNSSTPTTSSQRARRRSKNLVDENVTGDM